MATAEPILVTTYGNRACITDQVAVEYFGPELWAWVREHCERPIDDADVWLLPVGED